MRTINSYLAKPISLHKDKLFLIQPSTGEQLTFGAFALALAKVVSLLEELAIKPGDIVTLIADNSIDLIVMLYGTMITGAVAKPLNPRVTPAELTTLLLHSGSSAIFADHSISAADFPSRCLDIRSYRSVRSRHSSLPERVTEGDPALLIYTSGTTSTPKGVLLRQRNIVHNTLTAIGTFRLHADHVKACILPLFHMFGFISDLTTMAFCGGTTVVLDAFDIAKLSLLEGAIHDYHVKSLSGAPLMFDLLLRFTCKLAGSSMKFCISGAAPLNEKTATGFLERYDVPIIPAYGLTETTCFATISPLDRVKNRSVGLPTGIDLEIVSEDGKEQPPNEIGELIVAGGSVMEGGYFRSSMDCFRDQEKRWFKTGDLGYVDDDGYVYITGRKKNMVIRVGDKIYLEDLDACLTGFDGVTDSATIRFGENGDEKIACFVVRREGSLLRGEEVARFICEKLGSLKRPDRVIFVSEIPRTHTNKTKICDLLELAQRTREASSLSPGSLLSTGQV